MSVLFNDKSTSSTKLLAGVSPVDQILNSSSKNAIANKTVYAALLDKVEKSVNDLIYYYDTSQVYNKAEVRELIGQINTLTIEVVSALPTQDISTTTIYFVGPAAGTNTYDEYIYTNNAWAKIGDTSIDLSQYVTSSYLTTLLQSYYTKAEVDNLLNSYYTKTQVDNLLANVEIDVDDALSASSENPVQNKVIKAKIDDIEDEIDTKQDKEFVGTTAQWNALSTADKNKYVLVNLTDDKEALGVDAVDAVTDGDIRPVTSNAVFDGLATKTNVLMYNTTTGVEDSTLINNVVSYLRTNYLSGQDKEFFLKGLNLNRYYYTFVGNGTSNYFAGIFNTYYDIYLVACLNGNITVKTATLT